MKIVINAGRAAIAAAFALCTTSVIADTDLDISYSSYTLDNGLRLIVHEDHKAPIVAVNLWYHVGSRNEEPGKTGFAHLFEHLMFNGSENYDDEYFKPFERVGATNMNGTTWFDRTNYFENVPETALDMALWMESDRMGHLLGAVTQERLDEQRGVVQNEKRQGDNQPYGKTEYNILAGVFPPGHPYSWSTIGSMEDLDAASLEDVHEWFKTHYGPNNAVLVVAGDVSADEVYEKVKLYFGDIPPGPPLDKVETWPVKLAADKREVMQDRVPQSRIYKVWADPISARKTRTCYSSPTRSSRQARAHDSTTASSTPIRSRPMSARRSMPVISPVTTRSSHPRSPAATWTPSSGRSTKNWSVSSVEVRRMTNSNERSRA